MDSVQTKRIQNVCDENKFAWVELDHRDISQKLGTLKIQHKNDETSSNAIFNAEKYMYREYYERILPG